MPRKGKRTTNVNGTRMDNNNSSMFRDGLKWLNIKLEDSDISALERSESSFEYLAACIVGLASDGYGVSIRTIDAGKSYCVTLIRPDSENPSISYGLSGFSSELRDALLTVMYKFEHCLGGSFDSAADFLPTTEQRPRFR